jgi:hypothetical protein
MKISKEEIVSTINKIWLSNCFLLWTIFVYYFFKENQELEIALQKSLQIITYIWYILGLSIIFWILVTIPAIGLNFFLITYSKKKKQKIMKQNEVLDKAFNGMIKDLYEREKSRHSS